MGLSDQLLGDAGANNTQYPTYGTPAKLLDNLEQTESGGDPKAVNKDTGAQGAYQFLSSTVAMLKKQGLTFDPFDRAQSRAAADYYISNLAKQNGGDYNKAMAAYGGFVTKDPTNYLSKVMKGVDVSQQPQSAPTQSTPQSKTTPLMSSLLSDATDNQSSPANKIAGQLQNDAQATSDPRSLQGAVGTTLDVMKYAANPVNSVKAAGEFALNNATGIAGAAAGGLRGLYDLATGQGVDKAVSDIQSAQDKLTYAPKTVGGQAVVGTINAAMGAVNKASSIVGGTLGELAGGQKGRLIGESVGNIAPSVAMTLAGGKAALSGAKALGDKISFSGPSLDEIRTAVNNQGNLNLSDLASTNPKTRYKLNADGSVSAPINGEQTVVANSVSDLQKAPTNGLSVGNVAPPESTIGQRISQVRDAIAKQNPSIPADQALRHAQAKSLPVPMDLTDAQASGDPVAISNELNSRGKYPQTAQLLNQQNETLLQNLNAVREKAAPYISGSPTDIGQALVDSYKKMDAAAQENVSQQYKAVTDANAGKFPLDVNKFLDNSKQVLDKKNVAEFVPPEVQSLLGRLESNPNMTFDNFINLDKILSQQERAAMNSPKGQTGSYAVGLIREELNKIPAMSDTAAPAYDLLAKARATARARFDAINKDPAYKAVVGDSAPEGSPSSLADKFVNGYISNGKAANVNYMMRNLSKDPIAQQSIKAGFLDQIRRASGVDLRTNQGTISQSGLNKALQNAGNKTQLVLGDDAHTLNTIGNVARYTQERPPGNFVNSSNTLTGALKDAATNSIETALNIKTLGAYGGAKALLENVFRNNKKPSSVMLKDLEKK